MGWKSRLFALSISSPDSRSPNLSWKTIARSRDLSPLQNRKSRSAVSSLGVEMGEPVRWFDESADHSPWIKALAEVRHRATREGWCYPHVQAIIVSIDQYAEAATGNRDFFLNKPQSIGGSRKGDLP